MILQFLDLFSSLLIIFPLSPFLYPFTRCKNFLILNFLRLFLVSSWFYTDDSVSVSKLEAWRYLNFVYFFLFLVHLSLSSALCLLFLSVLITTTHLQELTTPSWLDELPYKISIPYPVFLTMAILILSFQSSCTLLPNTHFNKMFP